MAIRDELLQQYDVNDRGIITTSGKFEGEPLWAPYFYEFASDGEELSFEGSGDYISLIEISEEDRREFPELPGGKYIYLVESMGGFVYVSCISEKAAEELRSEEGEQ